MILRWSCVAVFSHKRLKVLKPFLPLGIMRVPCPSGKCLQAGAPFCSHARTRALNNDPLPEWEATPGKVPGWSCVAVFSHERLKVLESFLPQGVVSGPSPAGERFEPVAPYGRETLPPAALPADPLSEAASANRHPPFWSCVAIFSHERLKPTEAFFPERA